MKFFDCKNWIALGSILGMLQTTDFQANEYILSQVLSGTIPGSSVIPKLGDGYGNTVSLSDGYLVTNAPNANTEGLTDAGALYFYKKEGMNFVQSQAPFSSEITGDLIGVFNSVHVDGDWLMASVGDSPVDGHTGPPQHPGGAVLVFHRHEDEWKHTQTLQPLDIYPGDQFGGRSLYFEKGWAFLSACRKTVNGVIGAGNVYVYLLNEDSGHWEMTQTIIQPDGPQTEGRFGESQVIHGNHALIGATGNFSIANGSAYFFKQSQGQWHLLQTLSPLNQGTIIGGTGDLFGFSVDFNKDWAIIGAPADSASGTYCGGALHFFKAVEIQGVMQWQFAQKAYSDQIGIHGAVGTHVILNGEYAYVNDNRSSQDGSLLHVGAVIVFRDHGGAWFQTDTILNPQPTQGDCFGSTFAIENDALVVGNFPNLDFYRPYTDMARDFTLPTTQAANGKISIFHNIH